MSKKMHSRMLSPVVRSAVLRLGLILCALLPPLGPAQGQALFSLQDFLGYVERFHPVGRQAELLPDRAAAQLRMARGAFDPKLYGTVDQKVFEEKNYYLHQDAGLKVATWPGIEVKAGAERANGVFVNPEISTPNAGLLVAGVSVPLGQGLVIDARRAAVRQAQIFQDAAEAERWLIYNQLLFEGAKAYWDWALAFEKQAVLGEALRLAQVRFEAIKGTLVFGDRPAIDTLEAFIQVQTRQLDYADATLALQQARLSVSNFLWDENGLPLELAEDTRPDPLDMPNQGISPDSVLSLLRTLPAAHPELIRIRYDLAALDVERRFKADKLKPKIFLDYNFINEPVRTANGASDAWFYPALLSQNYKWAISFDFPLFVREARGNLALTRIKIAETRLKQEQKTLELTNKVQNYSQELRTLEGQVSLFADAVANYRSLLQAEETKFRYGESSLFLINARESKLIEAQVKLLELEAKYFKTLAGLSWAAGRLWTPE